jgi:serine/threonine protein kinase
VFPTGAAEMMLEQQREKPISKSALLRQTLIPKRILREMKILSHLNHVNVVNLRELIPPTSYKSFKEYY